MDRSEHDATSQWSPTTPQDQTENVYFQQSPQAERTITKYKGDYGIKTKTDPKTGISYQNDKEYDFIIIFPVSFHVFYMRKRRLLQSRRFTKRNPQSDQEKVVIQ